MSATWEQEVFEAFREAAASHMRVGIAGERGRLVTGASEVTWIRARDRGDVILHQPEDLVVTADAGMTIGAINEALSKYGQWIPFRAVDGHDDSLGGATAAGIDTRYRGYGAFHERILGLRVLTPGFGAIQVGGRVVKNVAGYNLPRLFVGTRGHFGVIAQMTLKVSPLPNVMRAWDWEGSLAAMVTQAEKVSRLAYPWAEIRLIRAGQSVAALHAEWHGIAETIPALERRLGASTQVPGDAALARHPSGGVTLGGGVPRTRVAALMTRWVGGPLTAEWQSGSFVGQLPEEDAFPMMEWIRAHQGGVRVWAGPDWEAPRPPALEEAWQRLQRAYDPERVLR